MNYLLSFKMNKDAVPTLQNALDETGALNFVRKAMMVMESMEETTADLKAIAFMKNITPGKAKVMEHPTSGCVLVVQVCNDNPT